jgi:hypothetical protein
MHQLNTYKGRSSRLKRFEPQHGPCDPLHTTMILLDDVVEILDLADFNRRAVRLVVALDGGFIGLTAIKRDLLRDAMTADRLGQEPLGRSLVARLGQQEVDRLARLIHGTIEVIPLPVDFDVGLVHPPTEPHWPLAEMKCFLQRRTVFHDPPVNSGVIHVDAALEHEFFDMARAQRIRHIPADTRQNDFLGEMGPLEAHGHQSSPSLSSLWITEGDHISTGLK